MTKCQLSSCTQEQFKDGLCRAHYDQQAERILRETIHGVELISQEVRQFIRLLGAYPDISVLDMSERLALSYNDAKLMFRLFGVSTDGRLLAQVPADRKRNDAALRRIRAKGKSTTARKYRNGN